MKCPNCNETLVMTDRQGVEVDYCPQCRGVWLDRGELDKIIERSAAYEGGNSAPPPQQQQPYGSQPYGKGHYDPHYKHKKKKGFLDDFFDF
jgi:Zn-finger nucleic acid-binding protein